MDRLNKFLAHAGLGSRRNVEDIIRARRVTIDGQVVTDLGTRVAPEQTVCVDGKELQAERFVYWLVNKPRGYLCTNSDPAGRPRAVDLVPKVTQRVYTVGRLDEDSEGMLLMTNDGDLANRLMHPRYGMRKTYQVQVAGVPTRADLGKMLEGIWISEGRVKASHVKVIRTQGQSAWLRIVLREGKNREIRRMLARLEHKVMRLRRVGIGPLALGGLGSGKARQLERNEIRKLRAAAEEQT